MKKLIFIGWLVYAWYPSKHFMFLSFLFITTLWDRYYYYLHFIEKRQVSGGAGIKFSSVTKYFPSVMALVQWREFKEMTDTFPNFQWCLLAFFDCKKQKLLLAIRPEGNLLGVMWRAYRIHRKARNTGLDKVDVEATLCQAAEWDKGCGSCNQQLQTIADDS